MPPKNSLGRGLGAMFPDLLKNIGDKPAFIMCGIEELSPNRFQPRRAFEGEDQRELVVSVKMSGIIQPLIVRKAENGYEIIAGERRWRAARGAGAGVSRRLAGVAAVPRAHGRRRVYGSRIGAHKGRFHDRRLQGLHHQGRNGPHAHRAQG